MIKILNLKSLIAIFIFILFIITFSFIFYEIFKEIQSPNFEFVIDSYSAALHELAYRNYKWSLISSKIIFIVVNISLISGLYMAWMQLKKDIDSPKKMIFQKNHKIEVSYKSIKLSSNVVGLVILVFSLVFYFLYLEYVYPIEIDYLSQKIIYKFS